MVDEIESVRRGVFPFDADAVLAARDKLAPPSIAEVKAQYGKVTVGSAHPTGDFETTVDNRPPLKFDDKPTPSDESPPSIEEAMALRQEIEASKPKTYAASKMYRVVFNKRVELERDLWLSPHETHTISGTLANKFKADIDAAAEVTE